MDGNTGAGQVPPPPPAPTPDAASPPAASPPPAAPQPQYDGTPFSALILARKQLDEDTMKTWLLVALCAVSAFYCSLMLMVWLTDGVMFSTLNQGQHIGLFGSLTAVGTVLVGFGLAFIGPVVVVVSANRIYKRQYDWITAELVHGDLGLMLVDEIYGRMIQEWRESKFQIRNITGGEVHLGDKFSMRLIHFGSYYMEYFRISQGRREFKITPASTLNCWSDGIVLGCLTMGCGCLAWLTVLLPLRIIQTYPQNIATRRAALDYLSGKWDHALEEKYDRRGLDRPAQTWG